jgi:glutamine amidotransferase
MCWITRRHPFGTAKLIDTGGRIDFRKETTPNDVVSVVASRKLTDDETWNAIAPGRLCIFSDGGLVPTRLA